MDIDILAHAKVNLTLDVLHEREDGYHEIDTVMQEIELHDVVSIETGRGGFVLTCDEPKLELGRSNLVYKAWEMLRDRAENPSVTIHLTKNIPLAAGLAGGSTDCAATLVGLNKMWGLNLKDEELEEMAASLGSDVPFFIRGGTQRAKGRGEILTPLSPFRGEYLLLVVPDEPTSSRHIYEEVENNGTIPVRELCEVLEVGNPKMGSLMENQLETVTFSHLPILKAIKKELLEAGAYAALMSGSGPSMFGLFDSREEAKLAYQQFEGRYAFVSVTRTL